MFILFGQIINADEILLPLYIFLLFGLSVHAQNSSKADLSVYPNPTAEYISVNDNSDAIGFVAIFNLVGKKVKEFDFVKGELMFVADLPKRHVSGATPGSQPEDSEDAEGG